MAPELATALAALFQSAFCARFGAVADRARYRTQEAVTHEGEWLIYLTALLGLATGEIANWVRANR